MFLEAAVSLNSIRIFTLTSLALRECIETESRDAVSADVIPQISSIKISP